MLRQFGTVSRRTFATRSTPLRAASSPAVVDSKSSTVRVESAPKREHYSPPTPPAGGSLKQRITAFLVGVSVGGGVGWYAISQDVWTSAELLNKSVVELHTGLVQMEGGVDERIKKLEERIAELEKSKKSL
eukprot:g24463.t1